jgi:hypothetical protein
LPEVAVRGIVERAVAIRLPEPALDHTSCIDGRIPSRVGTQKGVQPDVLGALARRSRSLPSVWAGSAPSIA